MSQYVNRKQFKIIMVTLFRTNKCNTLHLYEGKKINYKRKWDVK